jgi:hypothetical protein
MVQKTTKSLFQKKLRGENIWQKKNVGGEPPKIEQGIMLRKARRRFISEVKRRGKNYPSVKKASGKDTLSVYLIRQDITAIITQNKPVQPKRRQ